MSGQHKNHCRGGVWFFIDSIDEFFKSSNRLFSIIGVSSNVSSALLMWYAGERTHEVIEQELGDDTRTARFYHVHLRVIANTQGY